jgi:hypothetical protein
MFVRLFNVPLHPSFYVYGVTGHYGAGPKAFQVVTCLQGPFGEGKNPSLHYCAHTGPKMLVYMHSPKEIRNDDCSVLWRSDRRCYWSVC